MLRGHSSVFAHSDFQRKNILVQEKHSSPVAADGGSERCFEVVAVLDWESTGCYPSYWGYTLCFTYFDWSDDWAEKVECILDPYVYEAALRRMAGQDLDS